MTKNREVIAKIIDICDKDETGTLFITTTDNKACHIVIKNGKISAMSYGRLRGDEVIDELKVLDMDRYSFKDGMIMPVPSKATITSSDDALLRFGVPSQSTEEELVEQTTKKRTRMYRGHIVED